METLIMKVKETTEREVEIKLPVFRTDGRNYFKVFSKDNCLHISTYDFSLRIQLTHSGLAYDSADTKDCSEETFLEAFDRIRTKQEEIATSLNKKNLLD